MRNTRIRNRMKHSKPINNKKHKLGRFNGQLPGKPGLAGYQFDLLSPFMPYLSILLGFTSFHIPMNIFPPRGYETMCTEPGGCSGEE